MPSEHVLYEDIDDVGDKGEAEPKNLREWGR